MRGIVGLDMNAAKEAFPEFLDGANLDSRQLYFVNQIVEYKVHNGMMKDLSVLQESPGCIRLHRGIMCVMRMWKRSIRIFHLRKN